MKVLNETIFGHSDSLANVTSVVFQLKL